MPSGFLFCIAGITLAPVLFFRRQFFSPLTLYIFFTSSTLGVAYLKLDRHMTDFTLTTWLVIIGSGLSFIVGSLVARSFFFHRKICLISEMPRHATIQENCKHFRWSLYLKYCLVLFFLFLISVFRFYSTTGDIPLFSINLPKYVSGHSGVDIGFWIHLLTAYHFIAMHFALGCFAKLNSQRNLRWIFRVLMVFVFLLGFLFFPGRGPVFLLILFLTGLYSFSVRKISLRHILAGALILTMLFISIAWAKRQISDDIDEYSLKLPYLYIANSYWNLDYALWERTDLEIHPSTWGFHALSSLTAPFGTLREVEVRYGFDDLLNESIDKTEGLNTISYQWSLYKDFGFMGVFLFPFLFSLWFSWLYHKLREDFTPARLAIYCFTSVWVILSFWTHFWTVPLVPFWLASIYFIAWLCQSPVRSIT